MGRRLGHLGSGDLLSGIPGSKTNHHGFPYSLTEEFVAVYRMHPLIPDEYSFRSVAGDEALGERTFPELGALHVRERLILHLLVHRMWRGPAFPVASPMAGDAAWKRDSNPGSPRLTPYPPYDRIARHVAEVEMAGVPVERHTMASAGGR